MPKIVILTDEEVDILSSYHKQRIAVADEQIQHFSEKKNVSEQRLQELATANEVATESDAQETEHAEELAPITSETEVAEGQHEVAEPATAHEEETSVAEHATIEENVATQPEIIQEGTVVTEAAQPEPEDQETSASIEEPSAEDETEQVQEETSQITAEADEKYIETAAEESAIHTPNKGVYTA